MLLRFGSMADRDFALSGGLWIVDDSTLALEIWTTSFLPSPNRLLCTIVWMRIPDLPQVTSIPSINRTLCLPMETPDDGHEYRAEYGIIVIVVIVVKALVLLAYCYKRYQGSNDTSDPRFRTIAMDKFLDDMEREKPIRFTSFQLGIATNNYNHLLGAGGFGTVYKGSFSNGILVAVKVLKGYSDEKIEQQFMAEVSTIGRTHHVNLVRLYGFCYERDLRALVYEYMDKGSLDGLLFSNHNAIEWEKLHEIAIGTAKGISYLHEECAQRIIHYDIKPGNVLLDARLCPKVADFGLAKLCNRDITHLTMTCGRGTPGYTAPELWMPFPVTYKCDVYSFGILLFEVLGRRRNFDTSLPESQGWFPLWVWKKYERIEINDMLVACRIEEKDTDKAERMALVALWCVQYQPELRPCMTVVVKMLEGGINIPVPPNPFVHMVAGTPLPVFCSIPNWTDSNNHSELSSDLRTTPSGSATPVMRRFGIEMASS